jgi:indole-3-glycerol phosphate synthase
MSASILDRIVETKWSEIQLARARCSLDCLRARAEAAPHPRSFCSALRRPDIAVIAEIKKASPTAGLIRPDFDPVAISRSYEQGGAAALSVLTDAYYFQGSLDALVKARGAVSLPALRKDFIVDLYQIYEARAAGADAILLIVAILDEERVRRLMATAQDLSMDVLVEVHTAEEMAIAREVGATLVGINNRDLKTFKTRLETTAELAGDAPEGALVAALSGIHTREDVLRVGGSGIRAVLVGESLMRQPDVAVAVRSLVGVPVSSSARVFQRPRLLRGRDEMDGSGGPDSVSLLSPSG